MAEADQSAVAEAQRPPPMVAEAIAEAERGQYMRIAERVPLMGISLTARLFIVAVFLFRSGRVAYIKSAHVRKTDIA